MSGSYLKSLSLWLAALACLPFGSVSNAGPIDWVTVGDPGNTADTAPAGYGAVATSFQIMKYEWTNSQYVDFLNSVDANGTNPNSVYNASMGSAARGGISFTSGNASGSKYAARSNMGDKPVNFVSWFDAARVSNWLFNGATGTSSMETGAYTLNSGTSGNAPAVNSGATYYIPTENQWYKAAYYKGSGTNAGYWDYATQSDTAPTAVTSGSTGIGSAGSTGNFANYNFVADWNGQDGNVTTVGTNGAASAYGAFDMSGNVYEWNDLTGAAGSSRGLRGGYWFGNAFIVSSSSRFTGEQSNEYNFYGFRLASPVAVPEPSTWVMGLAGIACGGWQMFRRRKPIRLSFKTLSVGLASLASLLTVSAAGEPLMNGCACGYFRRWLTTFAVCATMTIAAFATSATASTILFYGGDWDSGGSTNMRYQSANTGVSTASVYQGFVVPNGVSWQVDGLFFNSQFAFFASEADRRNSVTTALWAVRSGVSMGNGGTLLASGSSAITLNSTGRSDAYGIEYTVGVSNLSVNLGAGSYWMNVTPVVSATTNGSTYVGPSYSGVNKVGSISGSNYYYASDSSGVWLNYDSTLERYSAGVVGTQTPAVPEPSTYAMALAGLASGGFLIWRRRKHQCVGRSFITTASLALVAACLANGPLLAGTITVPAAAATTTGSSGWGFGFYGSQQVVQNLFPSSELTGISIGDEILGLTIRADGYPFPSNWSSPYTFPRFDIAIGSGKSSLTTNFLGNYSSPPTTVRTGSLTCLQEFFQAPLAFGSMIPFDTPYIYGGGNLLIELRTISAYYGFDADLMVTPQTSGQLASSFGDANATFATSVMPYNFAMAVSVVPEPSTYCMALAGIACGGFSMWRRRKWA